MRQEANRAHEYTTEIKVITVEKFDDVSSWRRDDVVVASPWGWPLWPYHAGEADGTCRARVFWTGRMGPDSEGWSPRDPARPPDGLGSKVKICNAKPQNQTRELLKRDFFLSSDDYRVENERVVRFPAKSLCERMTLMCFRCKLNPQRRLLVLYNIIPSSTLSTKAAKNKLLQYLLWKWWCNVKDLKVKCNPLRDEY